MMDDEEAALARLVKSKLSSEGEASWVLAQINLRVLATLKEVDLTLRAIHRGLTTKRGDK
jgi:hypothetical protein